MNHAMKKTGDVFVGIIWLIKTYCILVSGGHVSSWWYY